MVEERVKNLEAECRRLYRAICVLALLFLATFGVAASAPKTVFDRIIARDITLVDEQGQEGIRLSVGNSQSQIMISAPAPEAKVGIPFIRVNAWQNTNAQVNQAWVQMEAAGNSFDLMLSEKDDFAAKATNFAKGKTWKAP